MYSIDIRNRAFLMRRQGFSYDEICRVLKVTKSTLINWFKIITSPKEAEIVLNIQKESLKSRRFDKENSIKMAESYAASIVSDLSNRDMLMFGLGIYLGEGSKTNNIIRISNSDPRVILFSKLWLMRCFSLTEENFRLRIHVHEDVELEVVKQYWIEQIGIKDEYIYRPYIDRRKNKGKKLDILPFGTAHLCIVSNGNKDFGVLLHRKILATIDRVIKLRD